MNEVWDREKERIEAYVLCGCSCKHGPDESPCHSLFSTTQYAELRNECRELSHDEFDLVIMGKLRALTFHDLITWWNEGRRRTISYYQFGGHPVCKNTFCFLHNIGISKFNAIKASWLKNGLRPRERKHTTPHNTTALRHQACRPLYPQLCRRPHDPPPWLRPGIQTRRHPAPSILSHTARGVGGIPQGDGTM